MPAQQCVEFALNHPFVRSVDMTVCGVRIESSHFGDVLARVQNGAITVEYDQHVRAPVQMRGNRPVALYDHIDDKITLNFQTLISDEQRGLILHEAVHVIHDIFNAREMLVEMTEAAAYILQHQFLLSRAGPRAGIRPCEDENVNEMMRQALAAARLMNRLRAVNAQQIAGLIAAIRSVYTNRGRPVGFNGVRTEPTPLLERAWNRVTTAVEQLL